MGYLNDTLFRESSVMERPNPWGRPREHAPRARGCDRTHVHHRLTEHVACGVLPAIEGDDQQRFRGQRSGLAGYRGCAQCARAS